MPARLEGQGAGLQKAYHTWTRGSPSFTGREILHEGRVMVWSELPPASARDPGDAGSIPGLGRSPGEGNGNPLQCSSLENPMDRGAWWATVHRVTKSQT